MKRHLVFSVAILTTGLVIAVLAMSLVLRRPFLSAGEAKTLERYLQSVQLKQKPRAMLDLASMYGGNGRFEVLDAAFSPRDWSIKVPVPACGAVENGLSSERPQLCPLPSLMKSSTVGSVGDPFGKQAELAKILRGESPATDVFLLTSPFLDETGQSFAWELFEKNVAPLNEAIWLSEHLSLFKPDELPAVIDRFKLKRESFEIIARLSKADLRSLVEGVAVLASDNELFVRDQSRLGFSPLNYLVYDFASVKRSAGEYDLVVAGEKAICLERLGNVCWTYSSQTVIAQFQNYAALFLGFALAVFAFLLFIYFRSVGEKAAERERQRLSLQVLSHEFRTPVTSSLLLIDRLRARLPHFADVDQDAVMRLSSEASKLQRIIEMTKSYLQSESSAEMFNVVTLPSVNAWIEDFAAELDPRIRVHFLDLDRSIDADVFWLRFALVNLVQNAFAHGREPVRIKLSERGGRVVIAVEDEGACEFASLKEMTKPFKKSSASQGMGLGLNITETIVRAWGGSLRYKSSPTSFAITLERR